MKRRLDPDQEPRCVCGNAIAPALLELGSIACYACRSDRARYEYAITDRNVLERQLAAAERRWLAGTSSTG